MSLRRKIETNAPYISQGNAVAERRFGTRIGVARCFMFGNPHVSPKLRPEAGKMGVNICNRTPTDVLEGKAPLQWWMNKPSGGLKHTHKIRSTAFRKIEEQNRNGKLAPRVQKIIMVGFKTKNKTYRLWTPGRPHEIQNSAQASFQERTHVMRSTPTLGTTLSRRQILRLWKGRK